MFKLNVDATLCDILSHSIEINKIGKDVKELVLGVEDIHLRVKQLIEQIVNFSSESDICPIYLSSENARTLTNLQLQARKLDKDLNPIRFLFHAYEPKYWYENFNIHYLILYTLTSLQYIYYNTLLQYIIYTINYVFIYINNFLG